jgi:hypothetical protein
VRPVATPFDKRLAEINAALTRRTVVHGPAERQKGELKKLNAALLLPAGAAADRAACLSKAGRVARFDLLDSARAGLARPETLPGRELDHEMRKMSAAQRRGHLDRLSAERAALLLEAHRLGEKRAAYLAEHRQRHRDGEALGFDAHVLVMVRKQSGRRLRY